VAAWEAVPKSTETAAFDRLFADKLASLVAQEGAPGTQDAVLQIITGWNLIT
jgi:hypothetical protein